MTRHQGWAKLTSLEPGCPEQEPQSRQRQRSDACPSLLKGLKLHLLLTTVSPACCKISMDLKRAGRNNTGLQKGQGLNPRGTTSIWDLGRQDMA